MEELFKDMDLNQALVGALEKENITTPTEVQQKVIPEALKNKDLIVRSATGTGKTLAYLLPLFEKIDASKKEMQSIILVPTHELAVQVQRQIERLSQNSDIKVKSTVIIGNVNIEKQIDRLKEKPHIIVGSSGRILELIQKKRITAHTVKSIIIDEADRLLDENNIESVMKVIKTTLKERQVLIFSATVSQRTIIKAKEFMKEPEVIVGEERVAVPTSIEHIYFLSEQRDKIEVLRKLLGILRPEKAIIFVNTKNAIDISTAKLKYHGINAEAIQGTDKKLDRKAAMEGFRNGKIKILVASDIAARGLDIEGVTHIFNLDIPEDPENYLHRVGRTGRKGNAGVAISIVTQREIALIKKYENRFNISIARKDMYKGMITDIKRTYQKGHKDRIESINYKYKKEGK